MHTQSRVVINDMQLREVQVETMKDYKKRYHHGSILVNIDRVFWKVFLVSIPLASIIPVLFGLCFMYIPLYFIMKPLVNKECKKYYEYERRIQTVATKSTGVKPIELRNKKGAGE